ncbi:MAG: translation initiation factor IF-3, partial [Clostridia bacterium]|nr:translation initiation factor IF-3 [Clostridia bacterium]
MMNEEIRDREVRVIDQNGEQLGVLPIRKALELAEEAGLDLVKIVPGAKPPVCKLMDYDKYRYEQAKKEREIRKNQKVVSIKEVQLSATIEENDIQTKAKAAIKFLQGG